MMFLLKLEEIEYCYNRMFKGKLEFELEFPFYFTYHPPVIDERVKNQSSIFVFQPFSTNTHYFEGVPAQMWQKIVPDFTIEVRNPEAIRRELDAIGLKKSTSIVILIVLSNRLALKQYKKSSYKCTLRGSKAIVIE